MICPNCGKSIKPKIDFDGKDYFECKCGYDYVTADQYEQYERDLRDGKIEEMSFEEYLDQIELEGVKNYGN